MPRARVACATLGILALGPLQAIAGPVFTTLQAGIFSERSPGPDGLLGTADDVALPGFNVAGTASFIEFSDVSPFAGGNFFSFVSGTLDIMEPLVSSGGVVTVTDFSVALAFEQTTGLEATGTDIPGVVHELLFEFPGVVEYNYTLRSCLQAAPLSCLESDLDLSGFTLLAGGDPLLLPGITPELASYFMVLSSVAPPDWTAISLTIDGPVLMTSSNTRGNLAPFFIGGTASGVTALVTSDSIASCSVATGEPGSGDFDADGNCDADDTCPTVTNAGVDADGDGIDDACDTCPSIANEPFAGILTSRTLVSGQLDDDADGVGNACDFDYDQLGFFISPSDFAQAVASLGFSPVANLTCGSNSDLLCGLFDHDGVGSILSPADFAADVAKAAEIPPLNGPSCGAACTPPLGGAIESGTAVLGKAICDGPAC